MGNLKLGLQITLVGVAVVFVTFSLLVILMQWTRQALGGTGFTLRRRRPMPGPVPPHLVREDDEERAGAGAESETASTGGGAVEAATGTMDAATATGQTGGEIPVAVAAAISTVLGVVMSGTPYQVLSVKRVEGAGVMPEKAWSLAGRMDLMRSREVSLRRKG